MRGSRNFAMGWGVQARLSENSSDNVFFSPQLILQFYSGLSIVYVKENYNFPRFQRGPTFSGGGDPTFSRGGGSNFFQGWWV